MVTITKTAEQLKEELEAICDHNIQSGFGSLEYILRREIVEINIKEAYVDYKFVIPKEASNETNTAHGGYIAAMLDESMGYTARVLVCNGDTVKTADMNFNCLAPGIIGEEGILHVSVIKSGKRLVVLRGEMYQGDRLISIGTGSYARVEYSK